MRDGAPHADDDARVIIELARQLGSIFDLDTLLKQVEAAALHILGCDRASVFLYDPAKDELSSRVATGVSELRFSAKAGIAGEAAHTGKAILVPDAYADPRFNRAIDEQTGYRTRNMLTFPLVGHDSRVVGVLQVLNKLHGGFNAHDESLADLLSKLAGVAIERQLLLDEYQTKLRMERDLDLAREIQQNLLPSENPRVPGFDVAAWNKPADETGGDCFDFIPMGDERLAFSIADATGHGIGPALIIAECRAILRSAVSLCDDLAHVAAHVNRILCDDLPADRFVTACFGVIDPAAGSVSYVSAGHGPLLLYRAATGAAEQLDATGPPMGILPDQDYAVAGPIALERGDIFALVTDGFFEWARPDGEQFGVERIVDIFRDSPDAPSDRLIATLHERVRAFAEGTEQKDDLTAVLAKRL